MGKDKNSRRGLKICCGVTVVLVVLVVVVFTTLAFTLFKPKDPIVMVYPQGAKDIFDGIINNLNTTTVPMVLTIKNLNYASFHLKNTTCNVVYHEDVVAEISILENTVPARGHIKFTSSACFKLKKILNNSHFSDDLIGGRFDFSSNSEMPGQAIILNLFRLKATTFTSCNISFLLPSMTTQSNCISKIKL